MCRLVVQSEQVIDRHLLGQDAGGKADACIEAGHDGENGGISQSVEGHVSDQILLGELFSTLR